MDSLDREYTSLILHKGCIEQLADRLSINGGRHDYNTEVRPNDLLGFLRQCKSYVRSEIAFVKFVEDNHADAFKRRIVYNHSCQDAFCQHLNAGIFRHLRFKSHTITDGFPHLLAYHCRHSLGNLSGCQSSRFEHQDLSSIVEIVQNGERE